MPGCGMAAGRPRRFERSVVADNRSVVKLAAFGAPVTSNTAKVVVQYISDFEKEKPRPPSLEACVAPTRGAGGRRANWIPRRESSSSLRTESCRSRCHVNERRFKPAPDIQFLGADEGDEQTASGFHQSGTLKEWISAIARISPYHRIRLAVYASFTRGDADDLASERNIIIDFSGEKHRRQNHHGPDRGKRVGEPDRK